MGHVQKVDHIAIACDDLARAWALYGDALGGTFVSGGDDTEIGIRVMQVLFPPDRKVELITPLGPDSYLQSFLDRNGPGFHHLTMIVDDVVATDETLREAGFETTDLDLSNPDWRETYIRPRSGFGALVQLTDSPLDWGRIQTHITPEQVLAGEVLWVGTEPPRFRGPDDAPAPQASATSGDGPRRFGRDWV